MQKNTAIQFASPVVQQQCQDEGLIETLLYMERHSPYYKKLFTETGTDIQSIRSTRQLTQLPFTTKEQLQRENHSFLCTPAADVREYATTSGTLGSPVSIALTENDLVRLARNEYQAFTIANCKAGDVVQLSLTLDRQFMAGIAYYSGIRQLGGTIVRTGPGLAALQWEHIYRYGVNTWVGVPSFLYKMIQWAAENNMDLSQSPLKKAICIGESIREADLTQNNMAELIHNKLPVNLISTYASTEMQTAFTECAAGNGCHHQPDLIIVEIIGADDNPVPPGTPGEVVITTIGVQGMPLLRYRTGDICAWHNTPCSCGRTTLRLGPVVGRKQQMIKYRGTTLYPQAIYNAINDLPFITGYVAEARTNASGNDDLLLHVCTSLQQQECIEQLIPVLQARLRVTPQLNFVTNEKITAMQTARQGRKLTRFIDNRKFGAMA